MPIVKTLLNSLKCCFSKDEHSALDPVLVIEFKSSPCKQSITNSEEEKIYECNNEHKKTELLKAPTNKFDEYSIKSSLNELFECIDEKSNDSFERLTSK